MLLHPPSPSSAQGTTLIEVVVATGLVAVFLGSLFTMNAASMGTIQMAKQSAAASQVLQQRVESLRIANWHQVTDPDWVRADSRSPLSANIAGSESLKEVTETLTLEPFEGSSTGATQIVRTGG